MSRKPPARRTPHPLEWSIGAASAALVAALIGAVLWQAMDDAPRVPELSAHVDAIETTPAGPFLVRFTAANSGSATAAAVEIVGTLVDAEPMPETSGVTLDYVPAHSTASGWLLFDRDPRHGRLVVVPRGFAEP